MLFRSLTLLFLAQLCVGFSIVLSKSIVDQHSPLLLLTVRFSVSALIMYLVSKSSVNGSPLRTRLSRIGWVVLLSESLGAGVLFNFIMLSGLHFTNANSAGLITSLLPAVIILVNVIFFKQLLNRKIIISLSIAVLGLIMINLSASEGNAHNALLGNLLVFLALIPDSLYYVLSKSYPLKLSLHHKVFWLNALNLPFLYIAVLFLPDGSWAALTIQDYMLMIALGSTSVLFFVFWQLGSKGVDATYAALATAFMPLGTVILAWIILGEGLGIMKMLGMLMVMFSIVFYARK